MQHWKHAIVAVDLSREGEIVGEELSPEARAVVDRALWLGRTVGTRLTFVAVLRVPLLTTLDLVEESADAALAREAQARLTELVAQANGAGIEAESQLLTGHPAHDVIQEAVRQQPDVVLIAGQSGGREPRRIGATAIKVARKAPSPVWIVQPESDAAPPTFLVADDLTDLGQEVLRLGVSAAHLLHARLVVAHAIEFPLDRRLFRTGLSPQELEAYRDKVRTEAEQAVTARLRDCDYRTVAEGVQVHVRAGPADVVIEELLDEFQVDLLLIGTKARTGIAGMLFGSTVESILPVTPCSALAVKPEGFVSPVASGEIP